jgi:hypothetical protein
MTKAALIRWSALVLLTCMLASCEAVSRQAPVDCSDVMGTRLAGFPFDQPTQESIYAWVEGQFQVGAQGIQARQSTVGIEYWNWQVENKDYTASLWDRGRATVGMSVRWRDGAPTVGDALRCLGTPSMYRAYYDLLPDARPWTVLELWYPGQGIRARAVVTRRVAGFGQHVPLDTLQYSEPGTERELITRFWVTEPNSEHYHRILRGLKNWPGQLSSVEIDPYG